MKAVEINNIKIGGKNPLVLIAGPCVIEDEKGTIRHAAAIRKITDTLKIPFIFKSSYDKANRTSVRSYRGPGIEKGLRILGKVKDELGVSVLSDVHTEEDVERAAGILDVIQIPAFLSRQTNLLIKAAKTGKAVNIKKGQFLSPWEMKYPIEKVRSAGGEKVLITERGTTFGYNNLVSDFRSIFIMKDFGSPVVYDASHSVQMPGGGGGESCGDSRFIPTLMFAAAAAGADGIFIEVHEDPTKAPCDGPNMLPLGRLKDVLSKAIEISEAARK